jgi:hypothetical protein
MSRLINKLLSPNFWVFIASLLGIGGLACVVIGFLTGNQVLMYAGMWLFAPLVLGGILLMVIVIPLLIIANQQNKRE